MKPIESLYLRIFLPFSISLIAATAVAWWIATSLLTNSLEQRLESQLEHATTVIAEGTFPFTQEVLVRVGRLLKAGIVLIHENGDIGRSTLPERQHTIHATVRRAWEQGQTQDSPVALREDGEPFTLVFHRLPEGRNEQYVAVAALASLADVHTAAGRTAWWLGGAALLGTLALAWVGHRITQSITTPVRQLAAMAERIASGDRDVRVHVTHISEIGALASALNRMAERLQIFEQEVADQNRLAALGEMAARVAHEIRNPLTAIKLQVQLLGESVDGEQQRVKVASLLDEIRRLELVVSGALALGRPTQLSVTDTDLNGVVSEVTALMEPQLAHRGIRLETDFDALPRAALDADRIKQVIFNLLTNAADELSHGGTIRISTEHLEPENTLALRVEDSGPGIAPQLGESLFTRVTNTKQSGLGVGLLLSKELIELHQGTIEVDNSPTLGGARFTIGLPLQIMNHDQQLQGLRK